MAAHKLSERSRTTDIEVEEKVDFEALMLAPPLLQGLSEAGFERPSPIQLKAIPLGRCGLDLIAQAKSGTGKTCVFSVIALEMVKLSQKSPQVLVLCPTREIAVQTRDVIRALGKHMEGLSCHVFIGGINVREDKEALKKCQVVVGTPGRVKMLIEKQMLVVDKVRLFIIDEADKMLDESFQEITNWIYSALPERKQLLALSATYPEMLITHLSKYMSDPVFVRLNADNPSLTGVKQYYHSVASHSLAHKVFHSKVDKLLEVLSQVEFHQCVIFSNFQLRAKSLCDILASKGWPALCISGQHDMRERLAVMEKLRTLQCRVLISTDLTARGIDAQHINVVINLDLPRNAETYLHRIGRAGRYGSHGVAVTFVADNGDEQEQFRKLCEQPGVSVEPLPDLIPKSFYHYDIANNDELIALRSLSSKPPTQSKGSMKARRPKAEVQRLKTKGPVAAQVKTSSDHKEVEKSILPEKKIPVKKEVNEEQELVEAERQKQEVVAEETQEQEVVEEERQVQEVEETQEQEVGERQEQEVVEEEREDQVIKEAESGDRLERFSVVQCWSSGSPSSSEDEDRVSDGHERHRCVPVEEQQKQRTKSRWRDPENRHMMYSTQQGKRETSIPTATPPQSAAHVAVNKHSTQLRTSLLSTDCLACSVERNCCDSSSLDVTLGVGQSTGMFSFPSCCCIGSDAHRTVGCSRGDETWEMVWRRSYCQQLAYMSAWRSSSYRPYHWSMY